MGKKTMFTNITPLPPSVSREVAVAMLHNHDEMIELNPLVIEHHPIKTPRNAAKDEFLDCAWHEMTDRIHYMPGGIVKGKVTYKGCFHNAPNGLQTHIYAPMNLDIRERWTVCGTLPGEPEEPRELGLNVPRKGLYLREDGEIKCNMLMTSFVRKNLDKAHQVLVERLMAKAERVQMHLDSQVNTPQGSVPPGIPGIQRGSHMDRSNIVRHLSGNQVDTATLRSNLSRTSSDSAAVQSARTPLRQEYIQELPGSATVDNQKPLPMQPEDDEVDEAELQTVHPALREQYIQNRLSGFSRSDTVLPAYHTLSNQKGQFYQDDMAKRSTGKQFAIELEGSSEFQHAESSRTTTQPPAPVDLNSYAVEPLDTRPNNWRPQTTYGIGSEVDDSDIPTPRKGSPPQSLSHSRQASGNDTAISSASPSSKKTLDRFSTVSDLSEVPTPRVGQFNFANGVDNRFSVVSAVTEAPTPRFQQQSFAEQQQAYSKEQVQRAHNQNMF